MVLGPVEESDMSTTPAPAPAPKFDLATIMKIMALAQELGLMDLIMRLINKPKLAPAETVPNTPNVPTPIPAPPASTPTDGQDQRLVARVTLQVQKAVHRAGEKGGEELYTDERLRECRNGDNYTKGSALWLDQTAIDEEGEEWQGHSITAAGLLFRTSHEVYKNGKLVAFIRGDGGQVGNPKPWQQQNGGGVHWAQRAWKDSGGMNARATFSEEGQYEAVSYFDGVEAERIEINVS